MRKTFTTAVLLITLGAPSSAWAGFDEGKAALNRGDDATALRESGPLDAQGGTRAQAQRLALSWRPKQRDAIVTSPGLEVALSRQRIASIQRDLASLSYKPGPVDGVMGRKTRAAIRAFQAKKGLSITGKLSEELEFAIRAAKRTEPPSLADLKACQDAVAAKIWASAMRACRPLAGKGSVEPSRLSRSVDWLWAMLCQTLSMACL